jgi:hypothetical protein
METDEPRTIFDWDEITPGTKDVPIDLSDESIDLTDTFTDRAKKINCCVIWNENCDSCRQKIRAKELDEKYAISPHLKPRKPKKPETAWEVIDVKKEKAEETVDLTTDQ